MALEIKTSIIIQASPSKVWMIFTQFENYPEWNPFLTLIEGDMKEGEKIRVTAGGMNFKPKILIYQDQKQLQWIGRLLMPGIIDGRHHFELIDNEDGTTTFLHSERFSGILVPLIKNKLLRDTKAGFEAMDQALKERVEA